MTISSETRKAGPFSGDDSNTSFPFEFKVFDESDLRVVFTSAAGVDSDLVLDSDYSVTLNADQNTDPGGTVTYPISGAELSTDETLTIVSDIAYTQETAITNGGAFYPQVVENALDKLLAQVQQLKEMIGRSALVPVGGNIDGLELPIPDPLAFLRWNSAGTALENADAVYSLGTFLQSGAGAVEREANAKMAESVSAADFGFSTSNTGAQNLTALTAAIAAALGRVIDIGEGDFNLAPGLGLDCILRGQGRTRTRIYKSGNGDLVNFYTNAGLVNISLYGAGATYTGRGLVIAAGEGQQVCHNANVGDFDGYCIDFTDTTAGSQSFWDKMKIYRTGGTGASYAVHVEDAVESAAYPRHFSNIESEGTKFIDLGGCNGLFVTNSYIGEVQYSDNSRGAMFAACRYGSNSTTVTMRGYNHAITGCNVSPVITLASGVGECAITGNSYNNAVPIVDNSGNGGRNIIDTVAYSFAPTFTSGGTTPTIGNGTLTAVVTRHGAMISVTYNLAIGSTTNLGTGELRFSLPTTPVATGSGVVQHVGQCVCYDSSGNSRVYGHIAVTPGVAYATCATEADVVFVNGPFVWATGDWLRATVTYPA